MAECRKRREYAHPELERMYLTSAAAITADISGTIEPEPWVDPDEQEQGAPDIF